MKDDKKIKRVFSLNLICFLRCKGLKEEHAGWNQDTQKVYFVFAESKELDELIREYKEKDTLVRLHGFIAEFKKLKSEVFFYTRHFKENEGTVGGDTIQLGC